MAELSPLADLAEAEYLNWKHHPVSKVFFRYLSDFRETLLKVHLAEWEAGKIDTTVDLEMRGRVLILSDLTSLPFSSIQNFYEDNPDAA